MEFIVNPYKDYKDVYTLGSVEEIMTQIEVATARWRHSPEMLGCVGWVITHHSSGSFSYRREGQGHGQRQ